MNFKSLGVWMMRKIEKRWDSKFNAFSGTYFYKNLKRNSPKTQSQQRDFPNALNSKFSKRKKTEIPDLLKSNQLIGKRKIKDNDQRFLIY